MHRTTTSLAATWIELSPSLGASRDVMQSFQASMFRPEEPGKPNTSANWSWNETQSLIVLPSIWMFFIMHADHDERQGQRRSQPTATFDLSLSESAGSRSLDRFLAPSGALAEFFQVT